MHSRLHVVAVDDHAASGPFLDAFFRHGVAKTLPGKREPREYLRPIYGLITADPTAIQYLLSFHQGLLYCSLGAPLPLALRPRLLKALQNIQSWINDSAHNRGEHKIIVFDDHSLELSCLHKNAGYDLTLISSRRRFQTTDNTLTGPEINWPEQRPSPLKEIYDQLLIQFFCDARSLEVHPLGEHQQAKAGGKPIKTTNDVNRIVVDREAPKHSVFAKFGAPFRLEREFANFNRLTAAVASELDKKQNNRVHMRRLFGYGHLSDGFRPIAQSPSDFLGLFIASLHSHGNPIDNREVREGRLDDLLVRHCADYQDPRIIQLIAELCRTLAVLQGKWTVKDLKDVKTESSYDSFFTPRRVLRLNFDQVHAGVSGTKPPEHHTQYRVCDPELMASQRQKPVDRLECIVVPVSANRQPDTNATTATSDQRIRLILKADTIDAVSEVVAVIAKAYEKPIRESCEIYFSDRFIHNGHKNYIDSWLGQLKSLVYARAGACTYMADFRKEIMKHYQDIFEKVCQCFSEPGERCILAKRIHGDLYLVNILWSRKSIDDAYDFSVIDFEKMKYDAPAAWDYVILELSLRFHWFMKRYKEQLQGGSDWNDRTLFGEIDFRIRLVEERLIDLSPISVAHPELTPVASGLELLRNLVKAVRAGFLEQTRKLPSNCANEISDEEILADYNRTLLIAAASRAIGRHPDDYPTAEGVLRILWLRHLADNAKEGSYRLSPDGL